MNETVLVVDDEQKMREIIALFLREEGLNVVEAGSGREALEQFAAQPPDFIVLDVMLGDISGFDVCKKIREASQVPILFLSALGDDDYYMAGYLSGADDYIAKPFRASILALKIRRMLKRTPGKAGKSAHPGIEMDEAAHRCTVHGEEIALTKKEFQMLNLLLKNAGHILTREFLLQAVWEYDFYGEGRVVDNHIKNLRKKLGPTGEKIKTIISVGYKYEE